MNDKHEVLEGFSESTYANPQRGSYRTSQRVAVGMQGPLGANVNQHDRKRAISRRWRYADSQDSATLIRQTAMRGFAR